MDSPVSSSKESLDKLGMAIEIAKANGNPNWEELAERLGSASVASLKKTWQNLKSSHVLRRKGEEDPLSPKASKVAKPKTPRKKAPATPKKKTKKALLAAVEEDMEAEAKAEAEAEAIKGEETEVDE